MFLETDKNRLSMWIGVASSAERLREYVEADYSEDDDDGPSSEFGADFGIEDLDEDFLEVAVKENTASLTELLDGLSFVDLYQPLALKANGGDRLSKPVNAVILLFGHVMPVATGTRGRCKDPSMSFFSVLGPADLNFDPNPYG